MKENDEITIHNGFPNPATDTNIIPLDISNLLIKHPESTFLMRIDGSMHEIEGIFHGDIVIIDRSLNPVNNDRVIWWNEEVFVISKLAQLPIDTTIWGVVTAIVHRYRL